MYHSYIQLNLVILKTSSAENLQVTQQLFKKSVIDRSKNILSRLCKQS